MVVPGDLPGTGKATRSVFPRVDHQLCFVHAARNARNKVRRKDQAEVLASLKAVYLAGSEEDAELALSAFADALKKRCPGLVRYWRENFPHPTAFLRYSEAVRPYIYIEKDGTVFFALPGVLVCPPLPGTLTCTCKPFVKSGMIPFYN